MTTVFLVRHATTAATGTRLGGRTDAPLDEAGREQAAAVADRLNGLPFKAVYASPLARTLETAAIVAEPHGLEVRPAEGLLEVEYGRWTDRAIGPLTRTKLWPVIQARPSLVRFPEGESLRGMQMRAADGVEQIVGDHPKRAVVAVTHADVIKALVAFYLGLPLDLFQRLVVSPASVTVLQLGPGSQPALLRFNDDGPLTRAQFAHPRAAKGKA